ncbi:MAG: zinc-ribbon domain-containing protein [Lachnospiraceae bacterium]|nr:zinc-ribbon domain-containing protein [Lachnospiraceae bacterium]
MVCSNCGKEIQDGSIFCSFCGVRCIKRLCTACGTELKEGQLFCYVCGLKYDNKAQKETSSSPAAEVKDSESTKKNHSAAKGIMAWL